MDIQQALLDFDATIKAKPELTDEELFQKFPEFDNDSTKLAAARDYSATLNSDKYKGPEEFNHKFPEFFDVKKKDGGNSTDPSQSVSASQSGNQETDPIFGLLRKRQKLQSDKKAAQAVTSAGGPLATPVSTADVASEYDKSITAIDEEIKKKGYNVTELEKLFGKVSNLDFSDEELKGIYDLGKSNPFAFGRKIAAINWQGQLYDAIYAKYRKELPEASAKAAATTEINSIIALNTDNSYEENKRNAAAIKQKIYDYTAGDGELRKEILGQFGVDRAYGYGIDYNDKDAVIQSDKRSSKMNKFQILGMDYLQNTDDERFFSRNKMLNVTDEERNKNLDNVDFNLGLQSINKEAEDIGMKLTEKAALERLTRLAPKYEKGELTEGEKVAYNKSLQNLKEVNEYRKSQRSRYPMAINAEVDSIVQEATGAYNNMAQRFVLQTGEQVDNAVTFVKDLITAPFISESAKNARDIEQLGDKRIVQSSMIYAPGNESIVERDFNITFSKQLQAKIDEINSSKLSDAEKIQAKRNATLENFDQVAIAANPNAGKVNLTVKTVLGATSAVVSQMLPQIAIAMGTGGAGNISKMRSLATLFGSTFATAYQPYYAEALANGAANPTEYALKRTFIEASTELIGDDLERVKKLFKGSGIAGDIAGSITEAEWKSFSRQGSVFQRIKDKIVTPAIEGVIKPAVQEGGEEVLSQLGTNYLDDEDLTKGVKESFVTTGVGMVGMQLVGLPFSYNNINRSQKYTLFEAGSNPAQYMSAVDESLKNGDINAEEAQKRKKIIKDMGDIVNTMMTQRQDGKPLTDNEKVDYAFNEFVKKQSQAAAKNAPSGTAAKMNETAAKVDAENDAILSNTGDQSLSAQPVSKIESAKASDFTAAPVSEGYAEKMQAAKDSLGSNGISVDVYDQAEYNKIAEEGGQFVTNQDGTAMGVLKPNGEMVSLIKSSENTQKGVAPAMLEKMKELGGLFMDNFDIYLTKQYEKAGFRVVARLPFNEEYAPEGWQDSPLKDRPDVVFMAREDIAPAEEKKFTDYGEAKAYTEGLVQQAVAEGKAKLPTTITAEFADKAINQANKNQPMIEKLQQALASTGVQVEEVDDLEATVGQQGLGGVFIAEDGKILLDKKSLDKKGDAARIIYHEGAHPVMNIIRNTNKDLYDAVVAGVKEAAKNNRAIARAVAWAEKNYTKEGQAVVDDEAVVEVISMIADGTIDMANIPDSWKQKLIDFVNQIAKVFGLPQVDATDLAQFKATASKVAEALTKGTDIGEIVGKENVGEYQNEIPSILAAGEMKNPAQARMSGEPLNIYEGKEVKNLPVKSLSDIFKKFGGRATVINSDPTRVGELTLPSGKKIFMYGGPAYLALKENADSNIGFATTQMSKVNSWAKYVKEIFGNDNGVTLIGTQAPTSMMANSYALRYVLDAISTLPKTILKSKEFKDEFFGKDLVLLKDAFGEKGYNDFVTKYKKADLSDPATIDGMIAEMAYKVGDDNNPASFKARGAFVSNLLGGIALKSEIKSVEGDKGYVSKKPTKFIAKQLFDRLGLNQEKLFYELGEKSLVDLYMNEGKWGMAVAGFETDPSLSVEEVQAGGVKHPLFNSKFPGKNAFLLDGAYDLDQLFTPQEIIASSGNPYVKKASQMLAGSMYVKGGQEESEKVFKYNEAAPAGKQIQARKSEDLVEAAGLTKQMVQDDQGNYVFYHFSGKKLKSINPNKFGSNTRATGRDERPGVGISMYYTRPDNREPQVPNDYGYAVRVPKEQVYPFNADPLGLLDEAEAQFKAQYPDQAFDANKQVGFVTKVAAEKGFPMTVAKWNGKLRAQSTEALTPEYYSKIVPGTVNQIEVNPKLDKFKPGKKYQSRVEDEQEEKDRGFAKTYDQRDLKVIGQISQDAKTYFAISNKQTAEEVKAFMENKNPEDVLDYLLQQPQDIPGRVRIWMSGVVMDEIDQAIVAAYESGDKETEARLITKQANLIDQIAPLGTELGQAIQAFRRFYQNSKGSPAMFNHFFNNLVSKIEGEANRQLTEEEKADIKEIAQKLQDAPEGLPKDEAAYELGNYVGKITPVSAVDIFQAIWYAHILSGVTTQATNFFANFWNTFAEGVVTGIRESVKSRSLMPFIMGLKGFTDGVRLGATEGLDIFLTGLSKQDADKFKNKDLLEYFDWRQSKVGKLAGGKVGKILNFAGSWSPAVLKYVGRALAATDAAFARSNTEAISRMMAYTQATKEGAKDKMTRVREILYNTKENIQNATQQAEDEGFVKGTRRFTRRVYEIMEQQRGDEFNQKAEDYGKKVTLNYEPEGFTRPLYNAAVALQNSSKMAKLFIPFTRIIANLTENSLNYTPLGYTKTITGKTRSEGGFRRLTKDERADFAIKATIGVATFMALAAMTGDDDDDLFDITANGTGDIAKNYELRKGGWRPYSIKLKSGRYVSYKDWPIMPLLAALGSMHDADKYQKEEPSNEAIVAMWGMANAVYDKSVMKGIQDFVEIFKPSQEYNQNSNFGDRLVSWGSDQASTMLVSNFTKQNIKFVQEAMDSPVKAAKGVERIYRDIPYLNDGLNPIIDVFGETISQTTSEKLLPFTIKRPKSDYIIKTLNENGVFIGKPQTRDIIVDEDTGESRPMTDQEYYNYAKRAGQLTKEYMIEYWDDFKEILEIKDQKERVTSLQKATNKIVSAARLQAMDLFYED